MESFTSIVQSQICQIHLINLPTGSGEECSNLSWTWRTNAHLLEVESITFLELWKLLHPLCSQTDPYCAIVDAQIVMVKMHKLSLPRLGFKNLFSREGGPKGKSSPVLDRRRYLLSSVVVRILL